MDLSLSLEIILMLTIVAALAGFIDAIAGGGGLLTIPAMLLANIPPVLTLGTNKLQAASGALAASITMIKKGVIKLSRLKSLLLPLLSARLSALSRYKCHRQICSKN